MLLMLMLLKKMKFDNIKKFERKFWRPVCGFIFFEEDETYRLI